MLKDYSTLLTRIKKNMGDAPLIQLVEQILLDAVSFRASDIHFEPFENVYRIRIRIDGLLAVLTELPIELASMVISRIKILASLDIAERRLPQDGRFKQAKGDEAALDVRVSICPTLYGEKIVLRLLNAQQIPLDVNERGYSEFQKTQILKALQAPQGMILVCGPTGSGKTVSLYTFLHFLNRVDRNISTVEDPIEIRLPGINQVHMNTKIGLSFGSILRAFLRQDPDVMMLGEIRDGETAEIAVKASQTGHLVLSTLHTNGALETIVRLEQMGVSPYALAHSVSLIMAQRLVRRLCSHCKVVEALPKALFEVPIYRAVGCELCHQGYKGRLGIYEVLPISEALKPLLISQADLSVVLAQAAQEGFVTLRQEALQKVAQGLTSVEEVDRIIHK